LIYLLTAIGLTPGGSSTVHIYTETIHRTTQLTQTIHRIRQLIGKSLGHALSSVMIKVMIRRGLKQIMPGDSMNLTSAKQLQCLCCCHPQGIINYKNERIISSISLLTRCVIRSQTCHHLH